MREGAKTVSKIFGYTRLRVKEKSDKEQVDALEAAGCKIIVKEGRSTGKVQKRDKYNKMIAGLEKNDVVIVYEVARFARSIFELFSMISQIVAKRAIFRSISEPFLDTDTESGRSCLAVLSALADVERRLVTLRTTDARYEHIAAGGRIGRRSKMSSEQIEEARQLRNLGWTLQKIADYFSVNINTIARNVR